MALTKKTLADLNDAVKTEMQLDPGLVSDTERTRFINDCLVDLGGMSCFNKSATLSVVDGFATLPDDFVDFVALYRGDKLVHPATTAHTTDGFIPQFPKIEVRPHVTETLTLLYTYAPDSVTLPADVPDIPYGFDNAIVDYAVARAHRKNGNIGLYREYMSAYETKKFELYQRLTRLENSGVNVVINSEETDDESNMGSEIIF